MLEKLAKKIFDECLADGEPVTIEEATEMAQMEINAKGFSHGAKATEEKPKQNKPRVAQVSDEKKQLFDLLWEGLHNFYGESAEIVKNNKEIAIKIGEKSFKVDIIEHRPRKK